MDSFRRLRKRLATYLMAAACFGMLPLSAHAATYYASPAGTSTACTDTSRGSLAIAKSKMVAGDTLILGDGTYSTTITGLPSGTASAYTTVKAENDGGAIIQSTTSARPLEIGANYIKVEGLKFVANLSGTNTDVAYVTGSYNKILRSAFVSTPNPDTANNTSNVIITGSYNLLEDCWAWGGGRYKFLLYGGNGTNDATYNILRRCVGRHDKDPSTLGNGVFTNYQGKNNLFQNCIALDSNQDSYYGYWHGAFFLEKGQKGGSVWIKDSFALNYSSLAVHDTASMDYQGSMFTHGNIYVSNMVAWKGGSGFQTYYDYGGRAISLDHSTFGATTGNGGGDWPGWALYAGAGQNTGGIATNNIIYAMSGGIGNCSGLNDYNAFYSNKTDRVSSSTGSHDTTSVNPLTTSLLYLPRIEAGSPLKGAGAGGSDVGATILYKRGVSGTLYGQTGYDTLTSEPLWPWPNEARIKADMSKYPSNWPSDNMPNPVRGFTSGTSKDGTPQTLTKYIWEFLGNKIPSTIYAAGTTDGSGGGTTTTTPPAADTTAPTVTSFYMPDSSSLTVPITSFTATDNTAVTGYCVTTTNSSAGCTWTASAPTSVTFATAGSQSAYGWARDGSNNISAALMDTVTITLPSTTAPSGGTSTSTTGKTYYVRPDGHDGATGLANSSDAAGGAWLTLQKAANTVKAGDLVNVADGTYQGFMIQTAGTATSPITFRSINKGGAKITTPNSKTPDGINIESYSTATPDYIVIDGFNISNAPRMGVRAIGGKGIVVKNSTVYNSSDCGIFSGNTPGIQVLNNTTYKNGKTALQHNIYISNALSDNCVVRGNLAYGANGGNGIQLNGDWQEGGDGYISNAVVEDNVVYGNYHKGLSLISVQNGTFRNNVIYNNGVGGAAGGIHLVDQLGQNFSTGNTVVNNTIDEPTIAAVRVNSGSTNNKVFNNICIGSGIVFEGSGNYQSNNSTSSSGFANYTGHDYRLTSGSPAVDFGVASYQSSAAPADDINGALRPQGGKYDAGAYEYLSTATTTPPADTTKPTVSAFTMPSSATTLTVPVSSFAATDNVGVTGYLVSESATAPAASASGWSSAAPSSFTFSGAGSKTAYAWAKDAAGNVSAALSAAVTITITVADATAPTVAITAPAASATVAGTVAVTASATDNVGVSKVEFYLDGALKSTSTAAPYSYSWGTTAVANGTHTLSAKAYDAAGNAGQSAAVSVNVSNLATTTAPIAFVQVASAVPQSATKTVTVSYPAAQKVGNMNVVVVGWNDTTNTVQSVTDSAGNVYTLAAGQVSGVGVRQSIYYASGIKAATNTVSVTFSGYATYPDIRILEYAGLSGVDKYIGASGSSSTSTSGSVTTTTARELLFSANTVSTGTSAAGTGFTKRVITSPDGDIAQDRIVSSVGTYSATAPLVSSGNWVMQMVTFK